jgi:hypothetical protein
MDPLVGTAAAVAGGEGEGADSCRAGSRVAAGAVRGKPDAAEAWPVEVGKWPPASRVEVVEAAAPGRHHRRHHEEVQSVRVLLNECM